MSDSAGERHQAPSYGDETLGERHREVDKIHSSLSDDVSRTQLLDEPRRLVRMYARLSWEIDRCEEALKTRPTGLSPPLVSDVGEMIDPEQDELVEWRASSAQARATRMESIKNYARWSAAPLLLSSTVTLAPSFVTALGPVVSGVLTVLAIGASATGLVFLEAEKRREEEARRYRQGLEHRQSKRFEVERSLESMRNLLRRVSELYGKACVERDSEDSADILDVRRRRLIGRAPATKGSLALYGELAIIVRSVHDPEIADEQMAVVAARDHRSRKLRFDAIVDNSVPRSTRASRERLNGGDTGLA